MAPRGAARAPAVQTLAAHHLSHPAAPPRPAPPHPAAAGGPGAGARAGEGADHLPGPRAERIHLDSPHRRQQPGGPAGPSTPGGRVGGWECASATRTAGSSQVGPRGRGRVGERVRQGAARASPNRQLVSGACSPAVWAGTARGSCPCARPACRSRWGRSGALRPGLAGCGPVARGPTYPPRSARRERRPLAPRRPVPPPNHPGQPLCVRRVGHRCAVGPRARRRERGGAGDAPGAGGGEQRGLTESVMGGRAGGAAAHAAPARSRATRQTPSPPPTCHPASPLPIPPPRGAAAAGDWQQGAHPRVPGTRQRQG